MGKNGIKILMAIFGFMFFFIGRLNAYTITLNSNGGTPVSSPEVDSGGMILGVPNDPKWTNHMFLGWFDENGKRFKFVGTVLSGDITLTARWSEFSDIGYYGVIDGKTISIIMMDRNLGATTNDTSKTGSYGYYYQWGNNYGFLPRGQATDNQKKSGVGYGPGNWFVGEKFIKLTGESDWSSDRNDNLWGGGGDILSNGYNNSNDKAQRQGPCPDGYYIPSIGERNTLFKLFLINNNMSGANGFPGTVGSKAGAAFTVDSAELSAFLNQLKIPFAGRLTWSYTYNRYDGDLSGKYAYFWSSTPYNGSALLAEVNHNTSAINIGGRPNVRAFAVPIRCFKKQDGVGNQAYIFDANGGYFSEGLTGKTEYYISGISLNPNVLVIPEREGYSFDGWYTQAEGGDKIELHVVTGDKQLYAHWISNYKYTLDANGGKFPGGSPEKIEYYSINSNLDPDSLIVPVKNGYSFDGWYTQAEGGDKIGAHVVSGDMHLYAHWEGSFSYDSISVGDFVVMDRNLGATEPWDGTTLSTTYIGSYGYLYQWGNNYGFMHGEDLFTSNQSVTVDASFMPSKYQSGSWITAIPWHNGEVLNLWGSLGNQEDMQGPCPVGWHVPTSGEWIELWETWSNDPNRSTSESSLLRNFVKDLKLPFAGYRTNTGGEDEFGVGGNYWTSTPISDKKNAWDFLIKTNTGSFDMAKKGRSNGRSVRCFANTYNITYKLYSGNWESGQVYPAKYTVGMSGLDLQSPTKVGFDFSGWYLDSKFENKFTYNKSLVGDVVLYAKWDAKIYTITWKDGNGDILKTEQLEYGVIPSYSGAEPTKTETDQTGYTFNGTWEPTIGAVTGDAIYVAQFDETAKIYTITFVDWDGTELSKTGYRYGDSVVEPTTPSRASDGTYTYSFGGWTPGTGVVTQSQVYTATYTQTLIEVSPSNKLKKDICPNGDFSNSYYDGTCGSPNDKNHNGGDDRTDDQGVTYSDELQQAYERAYENGITTMSSINDANVYGELSRIEMAKMLSKYVVNVLGKTVEGIGNILFDDVDSELDNKYDNGVSISSEMEVMGVNMPNNKFRPFDLVPRSEFVTAFSRMKYGTTDGEDIYYSTHMDKLKNEEIITKTDPNMMELVGYVMIMFMRSTK